MTVEDIRPPRTVTADERRAAAGLRSDYGMFVNGELVPATSGRTMESIDPSTEDVLATFSQAGEEDVDRAVEAGLAAQPAWYALGWEHRARVVQEMAARLEAKADQFAAIDAVDGGIPVAGMRKDVANGVSYLRYFSGVASELKGETLESSSGAINLTLREPYGVVGRIVPFNHPLQFAVAGIAGPLAAGNAVVLKPSDHTPLSALHFAELVADLVPPGILNVVTGDHQAGSALVRHPRVPRIAFTGSVGSGRAVLRDAAEHIKSVTLELGGKNPMIVFPDVDLDLVARAAVDAMNLRRGQGQSCGSPSRIFVHREVHDRLVESLVRLLTDFRVGDPLDPATEMGPLAFRAHYERVVGYVAAGREDGARLAIGGARPEGLSRGLYLSPTLFDGVTTTMRIAREEIFGPVISLLEWDDQEAVLAAANELDLGLTANIWTNDLTAGLRMARAVEAGYVWVNGKGQRPFGAPFGGHKLSGLGSENGLEELLSYTRTKNVNLSGLG